MEGERSEQDKDGLLYTMALGKIEQYKLLESVYKEVQKENTSLKQRLGLEETSTSIKRSQSITQQILEAADSKELNHPAEFLEVMKKETDEAIKYLTMKFHAHESKLVDAQRGVESLENEMEEKMKEMKLLGNPSKEERERRRKSSERKEESPRTLSSSPSSSLSAEDKEKMKQKKEDDEEESEDEDSVDGLKMKIEAMQQRIFELLNHNQKWNDYCKELQEELENVKTELSQYKGRSHCPGLGALENVKKEALSPQAKTHIEELETKVSELEKELAAKEATERQFKEKFVIYEEQINAYKEDFENEQRAHTITKNQLDSTKTNWKSIYAELQRKNEELRRKTEEVNALQSEMQKLKEKLEQAFHDRRLIDNRQQRLEHSSYRFEEMESAPAGYQGEKQDGWTCDSCTFLNLNNTACCEVCSTNRCHQQQTAPVGQSQSMLKGRSIREEPEPPRTTTTKKPSDLEEDGCWYTTNQANDSQVTLTFLER